MKTINDLLIEFDEMGFAPTTPCPDPEKYATEWREKVRAEFERLESENTALRVENEDYKIEDRRAERISKHRAEDRARVAGKISRCHGCEYKGHSPYFEGNFRIEICKHPPFRGKWIVEIEKCPKYFAAEISADARLANSKDEEEASEWESFAEIALIAKAQKQGL